MLLSSLSTSRPRRVGWLHGEVDAIDFRPAKESDCCGSHVKRVLKDRRRLACGTSLPVAIDVAEDVMSAREALDEVSRARHRR